MFGFLKRKKEVKAYITTVGMNSQIHSRIPLFWDAACIEPRHAKNLENIVDVLNSLGYDAKWHLPAIAPPDSPLTYLGYRVPSITITGKNLRFLLTDAYMDDTIPDQIVRDIVATANRYSFESEWEPAE